MPKKFFAAAKNHQTRKLSVLPVEDFYHLLENDTVYRKFCPNHAGDFSKKNRYGKIDGSFMVLYTIMDINENAESLRVRIMDPSRSDRIRNEARISVDVPRLQLKDLKPFDEVMTESKKEKKSTVRKVKKRGGMVNQNDLSMAFKKPKASSLPEVTTKKPTDTATAQAEIEEYALEEPISDSDFTGNGDSTSSVVSFLNGNSVGDTGVYVENLTGLEILTSQCTGNCEMVAFFKAELAQAHEKIERLEKEKEERLQIVSDQISQLNEKMSNIASHPSNAHPIKVCPDVTRTGGRILPDINVPTEGGLPIPEKQIHVGEGVFISEDKVESIEGQTFAPRKRIRSLLIAFYPNDYLQRTRMPQRMEDGSASKLISETNLKQLTGIMQRMVWDGLMKEKAIDEAYIGALIKSVTWELREEAKFNSLPPEQQREIKDKKKERARLARLAKKKEIKKKKKKNQVTVQEEEDSDDGSDAEKEVDISEESD